MKMRKTQFNWFSDDWKRVKNHCRTTDNKDFTENEATETFKKKLLISEHSPIRLLEFDWSWKGIKYWLSTEWSRHKFEKFISTSRDDRKGVNEEHPFGWVDVWDDETKQNITYAPNTRDDIPEKFNVNFDGYANMQNLIDVWRKRLCHMATDEARELAEDFKIELHETHPLEADVLMPNCLYRMGCPEFYCCGHIGEFFKWYNENHIEEFPYCNIQKRYDLYNEWFYSTRKETKQ